MAAFASPRLLEAAAPWGRFHATPLRGPFAARLLDIHLDGVVVEAGCCSPSVVVGTLAPDMAAVLLPLDGAGGMLLEGRRIGPCSLFVCGPGARYSVVLRRRARWVLVLLPGTALAMLGGVAARSAILRPGAVALYRAAPAAWQELASLLRDAATVARRSPAVFDVAEARRSLRHSVLETLGDLLRPAPPGEAKQRLRLARPDQRRVVHAALDLLGQDAASPDVAGLAAALGLRASRLESAAQAVLGMSLDLYRQHRQPAAGAG